MRIFGNGACAGVTAQVLLPLLFVALIVSLTRTALSCDDVPVHFPFIANTGEYYSIVLDSTSACCNVEECDEIAVFDGDLCVGASVFQGSWPLAITAWKDDSQTSQVDGYISGNQMRFRAWHYWTGEELEMESHFEDAGGGLFEGAYYSVAWLGCDLTGSMSPPLQLSPANGAQNVSQPINLSWSDVIGITSYRLQLDDDLAFGSPEIDVETEAPYFDANDLPGETTFYWRVSAMNECGSSAWSDVRNFTTGIVTDADNPVLDEVPRRYSLSQNHPNPFNMETSIEFSLAEHQAVTISIYSLLGERVRILLDGIILPAGESSIRWDGYSDDGRPVPSGVYFYRIKSGGFIETRKMVLMK